MCVVIAQADEESINKGTVSVVVIVLIIFLSLRGYRPLCAGRPFCAINPVEQFKKAHGFCVGRGSFKRLLAGVLYYFRVVIAF